MSRPASNGSTANWAKPSGVKKRKAEDELRSEQRLAKRFDLLNLEQNGKLYLPVQHSSSAGRPHVNGNYESESMHVDDTKDKIYIHNLDEELAELESEEEKLVFLPDIEKKLGRIPKSVLLGEGHPCTSNEVVLYSVPSSLSVPEEQDNVRKAIIESRARAREKQLHDAGAEAAPARQVDESEMNGELNEVKTIGGAAMDQVVDNEDADAMDLG